MEEKIEAWLALEESAGYYLNAKNFEKADKLYSQLVRSLSKEFSANDLNLLWAKRHWSEVLTRCGKFEDADRLQYDLLETLGRPDPGEERDIFKEVIDLRIERAKELHASDHFEEALAILNHARDYSTEVLGWKDAWTDQIRLNTETVREDQIRVRLKQQRRALRAEHENGKREEKGEKEGKGTRPTAGHVHDDSEAFRQPGRPLLAGVGIKFGMPLGSFQTDIPETSLSVKLAEYLKTGSSRRPRQSSMPGEVPTVPASPDLTRGRLLNQAQPSLAVPEDNNANKSLNSLRSKSEEPPPQKEATSKFVQLAEPDLVSFTDVQLLRVVQLLSGHDNEYKMYDPHKRPPLCICLTILQCR